PTLIAIDLLDGGRRRKAGDDRVGQVGDLIRCIGRTRSFRRKAVHRAPTPVMNRHLMTRFEQIARHREAHVPEADEPNLHPPPSFARGIAAPTCMTAAALQSIRSWPPS